MENNNLLAAAASAFLMSLMQFYSHLAPWLLLGLVLVLVDLRFGVKAARARGEEIRVSRACRRTINKTVDYLCWVTVAEACARTFGLVIGTPVVGITILFVIYGIELSSSVNNYLEYKGVDKRFDFFKSLGSVWRGRLLEDGRPARKATRGPIPSGAQSAQSPVTLEKEGEYEKEGE